MTYYDLRTIILEIFEVVYMHNKYYDNYEFLQVLALMNIDPYECEARFIEYLDKYPHDYTSYTYYASLLVLLRKYEQAEDILEKTNLRVLNDLSFKNDSELYKTYIKNYNYSKIKLLIFQNKYMELYNTYIKPRNNYTCLDSLNIDELSNTQTNNKGIDFRGLKLFCWKKMGMMNISKKEKYSYLFKQIIEYNDDEFLDHIKKHLMDYNTNADENNNSMFVENFPIQEVLDEVKKMIPNDRGLHFGFLDDTYTFKYDECGRVNNKITNYFQVICIHDTNDIITMYPTLEGDYLPYIDLNILNSNKQNDNVKVKRKSQIDKFNQRFAKKSV